MTVGLGDRVPMASSPCRTLAIGNQDPLIRLGMVRLQPRQQCGPKVEAYIQIVVDFGRSQSGKSIGSIAFGVNSLIPVVKRRSTRLRLDFTGPGILAWWLVKMPVNY